MRNNINRTMYIDDLRPEGFNDLFTYKHRIQVRINGYPIDECRDIMMRALVAGDFTIKVTGHHPGYPLICLGWEEKPDSTIPWEEPVTQMIGSFRLNEILCRFSHDYPHVETQEFTLDGVPHVLQKDGYLLREGVPIMRVIRHDTIPVCLRLAGTASKNYSFTHEIPVRALSGDDMHKINCAEFERMIGNILSVPNANTTTQFNLVLGVRRWAKDYADVYRFTHLPMTEAETLVLAKEALLNGGAQVSEAILRRYRELYELHADEPLPGFDQDDLNTISASQA